LKFISDLPQILEKQLSLFLGDTEKKDLKLLEKSLIYYEKCSEFLNLHKANVIRIYKINEIEYITIIIYLKLHITYI